MNLDDEQRCQVASCLKRVAPALGPDKVNEFISKIEAHMAKFQAQKREDEITYRQQHDDLRELWLLASKPNPQIDRIFALIENLPPPAARALGNLALLSIEGLRKPWAAEARRGRKRHLDPEPFFNVLKKEGFQAWARVADPKRLVEVIQVTATNGAVVLHDGKQLCIEPRVMKYARRHSGFANKGGRPRKRYRSFTLIGHLAHHWEKVTGEFPEPGRSDKTAFGELVYSVFDWMNAGSPEYALRRWWAEIHRTERLPVRPSTELITPLRIRR
jgi:hypothetical protein